MPTDDALPKSQEENPMLAMIRAMATFDPHHLMAAMQKWLPQSTLPGFDPAGWTAIQEKNMAALQSALRETQTVLNDSATQQVDIVREWLGTAVRATGDVVRAGNPFDASGKEIEFAFSSAGEVTMHSIEALKATAEKLRDISNQLGSRCVEATAEMKKMASAASA